jgi:hypothetical protein
MNTATSFETIAAILAEVRKQAEVGNWTDAATAFDLLAARIESGPLPQATDADRAALETAKAHLDALTERALPLHKDMATLLKAFG